MMRGLFGKSMKPDYMMPAYSMPQSGTITDGANLGTPAPQQQRQSFWQGGNRFTGRDALAGALAAIGDGLRGWAGGPTGAVEGLIAGRMAPQQQAAALAAEQRKRAAELADYEAKQQIDQRYRAPKTNDTIEDFNWYKGLSPEDRALYEQMRPVYRQGADGQFYRVDTAPAQQGFDTLPEGYTIRQGGGASNGTGGF